VALHDLVEAKQDLFREPPLILERPAVVLERPAVGLKRLAIALKRPAVGVHQLPTPLEVTVKALEELRVGHVPIIPRARQLSGGGFVTSQRLNVTGIALDAAASCGPRKGPAFCVS